MIFIYFIGRRVNVGIGGSGRFVYVWQFVPPVRSFLSLTNKDVNMVGHIYVTWGNNKAIMEKEIRIHTQFHSPPSGGSFAAAAP